MEVNAYHATHCDACNAEISSSAKLGQTPMPVSSPGDSSVSVDLTDWRDPKNPQKRGHHFCNEACLAAYLGKNAKLRKTSKASLEQVSLQTSPSAAYWEVNLFAATGKMTPKEVQQHHHDNKPYGNVEYADPKNHKYPIDTEAHVRAALSYINHTKNAGEYSPAELAAIKSKIHAAAKKFGIKVSE